MMGYHMNVIFMPQDTYDRLINSEELWIKNYLQSESIHVDNIIYIYKFIAMNTPNINFKKPVVENLLLDESLESKQYNLFIKTFELLLNLHFFVITDNDLAFVRRPDRDGTGQILLCVPKKKLCRSERKKGLRDISSKYNIIGLLPNIGNF